MKEVLDKLQDSHKLIERHLQNAEAHQREANTLSTDLDECKDKMKKLETALDSLNKELHIEKTLHSQSVETWSKQVICFLFMVFCTFRSRRGCDHMVVGFIAAYAISAYHH